MTGRNFFQSEMIKTAALPAWNDAIARTPTFFPGRVMYLPVAASVELDGAFSNWLPPAGDPAAPRRTWVRVRLRDGEHFCPPGTTRFAAAVLQDLTAIFHLPPAEKTWWASPSIVVGWSPAQKWCPNDHPS